MPAIYVCSLAKLETTVARSKASHIATLISEGTPVQRPDAVHAENHLVLSFHDISMPMDGMTPPGETHLDRFLGFVREWNRSAPLVVHCWAGVSRSTAGAMIALCALRPDLAEDDIAGRIRAGSPEATPNSRMIAIADKQLERDGRLVRAAERIGPGRIAFEGSVFSLNVDG
jgi:predicted protein tyrosine phosphatase